jgi:ribosomal protein S18 acetylase RimI-like enzyme
LFPIARASDAIYFPRSEAGARLWTEQQAARVPDGDNMRLAIETLDGELVGTINSHHRRGYASEAVTIFLRYFFQELRYEKVTAHVFAFNEISQRLHEHLGFQLEGTLRNMIYTNGQHYDEYIYGLLKSEFVR